VNIQVFYGVQFHAVLSQDKRLMDVKSGDESSLCRLLRLNVCSRAILNLDAPHAERSADGSIHLRQNKSF